MPKYQDGLPEENKVNIGNDGNCRPDPGLPRIPSIERIYGPGAYTVNKNGVVELPHEADVRPDPRDYR